MHQPKVLDANRSFGGDKLSPFADVRKELSNDHKRSLSNTEANPLNAQINKQSNHDLKPVDSKKTLKKTDRTARIWNRFAERYAAKPIADQEAYETKLAATREHLHPEAYVLELGCGTGSTALAHAPYAKHITATDISARMIDIARAKQSATGINNVDFSCEAINNLQAREASFNTVMMHSVLHLLADWREQIEQAHRVLKPGGVLVTNTVFLQDDARFLRWVAPIGQIIGLIPPLSFFSRKEFVEAMSNAGFEIVRTWQPRPKTGVFMIARKSL